MQPVVCGQTDQPVAQSACLATRRSLRSCRSGAAGAGAGKPLVKSIVLQGETTFRRTYGNPLPVPSRQRLRSSIIGRLPVPRGPMARPDPYTSPTWLRAAFEGLSADGCQ